jgi:hypothetical protein
MLQLQNTNSQEQEDQICDSWHNFQKISFFFVNIAILIAKVNKNNKTENDKIYSENFLS